MKKQNDNKELEKMRHSTAHLLAAAVQTLWPKTKFAIGPVIENGFYYDFDLPVKISDKDLSKIEKGMQQIQKQNLAFEQFDVNPKEALEKEKKASQAYKAELIEELVQQGESKVSYYKLGDFVDLCRGPHVSSTDQIGHFKLLNIAGAYWRGDEKNKMLTRIYGTAWHTREELDKYLWQLEEAKKRDHRKLGRELELFAVPEEIGPGLFVWLPNGATIKREIENYEIGLQVKRGYQHVYTPHIGKKQLWVKSGHWDLYRDKMYAPMKIDEEEYLVKPMNCPMHIMVYKSKPRSYKDLPVKIAEIASVYRYEQSGELSGLARVRYFNQDDAHIFCSADQLEKEIIGVLELLEEMYSAFGLKEIEYWLTLRSEDKEDKYLGDDEVWKKAEAALENALKSKKRKYMPAVGEAKFYGPSIDVMVKDSLGRKWQCGTIQVDFSLPERFGLEYTGVDGKPHRPVMVHRAPLGSLERFMSILIEHHAGAFPVWLSPVQVAVLPITERNVPWAKWVFGQITQENIRAELDDRAETLQAKIRDATLRKIPYLVIVGDREEQTGNVSVRASGKDLGVVRLSEFVAQVKKVIEDKSNI